LHADDAPQGVNFARRNTAIASQNGIHSRNRPPFPCQSRLAEYVGDFAFKDTPINEVLVRDLAWGQGSTPIDSVPMGVIAAQLGHSDTRMTEKHYAHLAPCYVADTIRAALPDFGGDKRNVTVLRA
jgi:hypothetical protein